MLHLPELGKSKFVPLLTTLVLLLSVVTGVALVQRQQELRTKAAGNTYYVAPNGADGNSGTLSKPWRTIGKANSTLQAGDTVKIRGGTYNEAIQPARSGTSGNPITYTNYQGEEAIIRGNSGLAYLANIPGSYTVIDNLTFRRGYRVTGHSCWICIDSSSSTNNVIRNNKIVTQDAELNWSLSKRRSYLDSGIRITRARDTLVENNLIKGMGFGVHTKKDPKRTVIRGNTIASTMLDPIRVGSIAGPPEIQGILIEDNILEGSAISDGIQTSQNFDLSEAEQEKDVSNLGIVIRNNIIRHNAENAIDLKGAGNIVIEGNIIYGTVGSSDGPLFGWNRNSLGTIIRGANTSTRDVIIRNNVLYDNSNGPLLYDGYRAYNNTLLANNRDYTGPNSTWTRTRKPDFNGIRQIEGDIAVKNNIVVSHTTAEATLRTNTGSSFINNNIYYNSNGVYLADFRGNNEWDRIPFSQWTSYLQSFSRISGNDEQSLVCKPEFVNVPSSLRPVGVHTNFDFRYTGNCSIVGAPLTFTAGASSGRNIRVQDARYFFDGYGVVSGDEIIVGSNSPVTITTINYSTNTITINRSIAWNNNDPVKLASAGTSNPVGAHDFGSGVVSPPISGPPPTPTLPPLSTSTPTPTSILAPGCYLGVDSWQNFSMSTQKGTFSVEYDITPQDINPNAIVALSSSPGSTFDDYATLVRFRNGIIDVRNGSSYSTDTNFSFNPGTTYHLKQDTNVTNHTYSVWVTPQGGNTQKLATDYAFRTPQSGISSISNWGIWEGIGSSQVCNFTLNPTPSSTPTPTSPPLPGDINGDGTVNILDFQLLNNLFGTNNPDADLNNDGVVNILDFQILNNNFGKTGG